MLNAGFFDGHVETLGDLEGSNPEFWVPKGTEVAANASQIDPKVALSAIDEYQKINYWENNDGLDEKQIAAQLNELVQIGSVKAEQKPSTDKIVDRSLYVPAIHPGG